MTPTPRCCELSDNFASAAIGSRPYTKVPSHRRLRCVWPSLTRCPWCKKCRADHLADITLAFAHCAGNRAQRRHFTAQQLFEPLMRLGKGMGEPALVLRVGSAWHVPTNDQASGAPAPLQACRDDMRSSSGS